MSISISTEGRRTYISGNTYPHRDAIRAIGAHWDGERKMWWTSKRQDAETLVAKLNDASQSTAAAQPASDRSKAPRDGMNSTVAGRATYKGKSYYIAGRIDRGRTSYDDRVSAVTTSDGTKLLLYFRDGSSQFWAERSAVQIVKMYDRPQSIAGLKRFAEEEKKDEANGITPELRNAYRHGWDGKIGSPSYYSSGAFDELDM